MSRERPISAEQVRAALREHFPFGAFAVVEEVRNGTGYGRQERYADAVVVSCWPSRGLWIAGVEIKVDRQDWLHELKSPEKSAEIQQWCDYWWIATPALLVKPGELPATWGLLEYDAASRAKDKLVVAKEAPKLEPQPLSLAFAASLARSFAKSQQAAHVQIARETEMRVREELGAEAVDAMRLKLNQAERHRDQLKEWLARAEEQNSDLGELRALLGLHWGARKDAAEAAIKAAREFQNLNLAGMADRLTQAAELLRAAKGSP